MGPSLFPLAYLVPLLLPREHLVFPLIQEEA